MKCRPIIGLCLSQWDEDKREERDQNKLSMQALEPN